MKIRIWFLPIIFVFLAYSQGFSQCPTAFYISGGGTVCTGQTPSQIVVVMSQSNVTYKLYQGTVLLSTITGTGTTKPFSGNPYTTAGTYRATATIGSCIVDASNEVTIAYKTPGSLWITASVDPATVCTGSSITLTASGGSNYTWTGSLGGSWSGTSITVSPTANTTYTVYGPESNCNTSKNTSKEVTVIPAVSQVTTPTGNLVMDDLYKLKTTYERFGVNDQLEQVRGSDGIVVSVIWGYNNLYPIAKIIGADYEAAKSKLSISVESLQSITAASDIRNHINEIRNGFASNKNVQVLGYTYEPGVGMSSQTDANGKIITYEYDAFGRLKLARDHHGDIIKAYSYNYKE